MNGNIVAHAFALPHNLTEAMDLAITIVHYKDTYYVQSIVLFLAVYIRCDFVCLLPFS